MLLVLVPSIPDVCEEGVGRVGMVRGEKSAVNIALIEVIRVDKEDTVDEIALDSIEVEVVVEVSSS